MCLMLKCDSPTISWSPVWPWVRTTCCFTSSWVPAWNPHRLQRNGFSPTHATMYWNKDKNVDWHTNWICFGRTINSIKTDLQQWLRMMRHHWHPLSYDPVSMYRVETLLEVHPLLTLPVHFSECNCSLELNQTPCTCMQQHAQLELILNNCSTTRSP